MQKSVSHEIVNFKNLREETLVYKIWSAPWYAAPCRKLIYFHSCYLAKLFKNSFISF